jgi:hypothetical protein
MTGPPPFWKGPPFHAALRAPPAGPRWQFDEDITVLLLDAVDEMVVVAVGAVCAKAGNATITNAKKATTIAVAAAASAIFWILVVIKFSKSVDRSLVIYTISRIVPKSLPNH